MSREGSRVRAQENDDLREQFFQSWAKCCGTHALGWARAGVEVVFLAQ